MEIEILRLEESPFTVKDLYSLVQKAYNERVKDGMLFTVSQKREIEFEEDIKQYTVFVAVADGKLAGTFGYENGNTDEDGYAYGEMGILAVDPEFAGHGIAKKLFSACIEDLNDGKNYYIHSDTSEYAASSIRVHRQSGFRIVDLVHFKRTNYYSYSFILPLKEPFLSWDFEALEKKTEKKLIKTHSKFDDLGKPLKPHKTRKGFFPTVGEWAGASFKRCFDRRKKLTLEEIHSESLAMLKDIDAFCRAHDIRYTVAFGTLIGAARHNGFIPWDDDIDIMMLREDYEKFREIYTSDKYVYLDCRNSKDVYVSFGRVADITRTVMESNVPWHGRNLSAGVFIDIFPMDEVPENEDLYGSIYNICNQAYIRQCRIRKNHSEFTGKNDLRTLHYRLMHPRLSRSDANGEARDLENLLLSLPKGESGYVAQLACPDMKQTYFPKEILENITYLPFEDMQVPVPKEYDWVLKHLFGTYLKTPDKKHQKPEFFKYATLYWK